MKRLTLYFVFSIFSLNVFGQNFTFFWSEYSMGSANEILVEKKDSNCTLIAKDKFTDQSFKQKISAKDCSQLYDFLKNYDYKNLGSTIRKTVRTYYETEFIQDSSKVVVNQDTIWLELIPVLGYDFDKKSNKFFKEITEYNTWTDGTTYSGEFATSERSEKYSIYRSRLTQIDYQLNQLLADLILKYDENRFFEKISSKLINDKPIEMK